MCRAWKTPTHRNFSVSDMPSPTKNLKTKDTSGGSPASNRKAKKKSTKKTSPRGVDESIEEEEIVDPTQSLFAEAFSTKPLPEEAAPRPAASPASFLADAVSAVESAVKSAVSAVEGAVNGMISPDNSRGGKYQLKRCNNCTFYQYVANAECARCGDSLGPSAKAVASSVAAAVKATVTPTAEPDAAAAEAQCAVALAVALNRVLVPASERVKQFNFDLDSLVGFDMQNATIGVFGDAPATGQCATLMEAFARHNGGGKVLTGITPFALDSCDIVCLFGGVPHFGSVCIERMKRGAMVIASNSNLLDVAAFTPALESGAVGSLGLISGTVCSTRATHKHTNAHTHTRTHTHTHTHTHTYAHTHTPSPPLLRPALIHRIDTPPAPPRLLLSLAQIPEVVLAMPNVIAKPSLGAAPLASTAASTAAAPSPWAAATVSAGSDAADAARVCFFSARSYFTEQFAAACDSHNASAATEGTAPVKFEMHAARLEEATAPLAAGCKAVCLFVNDDGSGPVLRALKSLGVETVLMRCAGFDKIDLKVAGEVGLKVVRVPAYSPEAVAQQAVSLLLTLKWKLAASNAPSEPLGLSLKGTTVGVLGTGRIGYLFAMIMQGFGCKIIAYDPYKNKAIEEAGIPYMDLDDIYAQVGTSILATVLVPHPEATQPPF